MPMFGVGKPNEKEPGVGCTLRRLAEQLGVSLTRAVQIERETLHRIRWIFGEEPTPKPVDKRKR